jgi:hypothetical protein
MVVIPSLFDFIPQSSVYKTNEDHIAVEVLTAVTMSRDVTPYNVDEVYRHFRETCCLFVQLQRVGRASN